MRSAEYLQKQGGNSCLLFIGVPKSQLIINVMLLPVNYIEPKKSQVFYKELRRVKTNFLHAVYPVKFISDAFFRFNEEKLLVPKSLFDETKLVVIRLPSAHRNEEFSKHLINKLKSFKNDKVRFNITWNTCKIKSLFNNKDKVEHFSCIIQKGVCSCGADYIGEKIRNVNIRWNDYKS